MKRYLSILLLLVISFSSLLYAQAPQKFSYQAVVRTQSGQLVASQPVGVRISILHHSATGASVYTETQTITTNANGLFTMAVGEGTVQSGSLSAINWADGPYYLKSEIDPLGGISYSIVATKQMMSVPYSLYAFRADTSNFATTAQYAQNIEGGITESQVLTMSHDTIFLTGGSFVVLPGNNKDTLYVVNNGYDTVFFTTHDTVYSHSSDTINRFFSDTIYTHAYDTIYSYTSDTVVHYTVDTVFSHSYDTVFLHSFDTVNRFYYDTVYNLSYDTVFTHSFDTVNRTFLDTIFQTTYQRDTVLIHMGADTLHLYQITHDTTYVHTFDTLNRTFMDTIYNRTFDTTYTHVYDTINRIFRDTIYNRTFDTTYTHVFDTVNRIYLDTVYRHLYDTVNRTFLDTVFQTTYQRDTVLIHMGADTLHLYQITHDTTYVHTFDTLNRTFMDTIYNRTFDTTYTHVYDTINRIFRDTIYNRTFDTTYTHVFDTVNRIYLDTVYRHLYDTVNRVFLDTVLSYHFDTINRVFLDTVFNRTYDTTYTHVYDTVNRIFLDTVLSYHFDTINRVFLDTVYNRTYDTTYTHVYDTLNRVFLDTVLSYHFDTINRIFLDTVYNRTYDTTYTHVYDTLNRVFLDTVLSYHFDTVNRVFLDTVFNRTYDTTYTHVYDTLNRVFYDTVFNRTYDTVYHFVASAVDTHYVDSVLLHSGFITSFTETQILSIGHDTIYLTGGSFVVLPAGFSGDYNDLSNKPTIPTNVSELTNDAGYLTAETPQVISISNDTIYLSNGGFAILPTGFSGDYNDLTNKPTIPTVPTNVSDFVNDAGYLTSYTEVQALSLSHDTIFLTGGSFVKIPAGFSGDYNDLINKPTIPTVPTDVTDFVNDAGYITSEDVPAVPSNVSAFTNDAGYLTSYTESQSLADVVANGNSAGHSQIKNVNDPTDPKDAVNLQYLTAQLARLQHQLDSLGSVVASLGSGSGGSSDGGSGDDGSTPSTTFENGVLPGVFSVAADRTVKFSQGNLQYTTTGTHVVSGGETITGTWRFAEHQYDYIGDANSNISSTYTGYIDLFAWGTSGWNSGAIAYQPWSTAIALGSYTPGGSHTNNLTGVYANADWGVYNAISNGGNCPGQWRTLTRAEWVYLLDTRTTTASVPGASSNPRYCKATVAGVTGLIIFPDNYIHPTGHVPPLVSVNSTRAHFSVNNLDLDDWQHIEQAGAVFLPAAGQRDGTELYGLGESGDYWTSSYFNDDLAYNITYNGYIMYTDSERYRSRGNSVRLVQDNIIETSHTACDSYTWHGNTYTTSGDYTYGSELLHLTINHSSHTSENRDAVVEYSWHDNTYTTGGTYTYEYVNSVGCPSVDTLHLTIRPLIIDGALPGEFSVSATKRVCFSQGNLQYKTTGTHTVYGGGTASGTWRFATHQYDVIGSANSNISSTYTGWIDLFGWGTSGWNSGATAYQPYSTSTNYLHYQVGGDSTNNLTGTYKRADWGVYNAISNGGNQPNKWRTLTKDEIQYLLLNRNVTHRFIKATVAGHKGVVLFPDNYTHPTALPALTNLNNNNTAFSAVSFTAAQWTIMEHLGCVLLPLTGTRNGTTVTALDEYCYYVTSTAGTRITKWHICVRDIGLSVHADSRRNGQAVRLVKELE